MATTNLITYQTNDILHQTGNGVPDHTASIYSRYIDLDDGKEYQNTNGGTSWAELGSGASWTKVTKGHGDFTAAATSESITLFTLTAGYILRGIMLKHTTAFAGTSWTACTLEVGISGATDKYLQASDVFQAVGDTVFFGGDNFALENWGSNTTVQLTATSTGGNLSASTAGDVEVYYLMEQVKS